MPRPVLSIVLATYNRPAVLAHTLARLRTLIDAELSRAAAEIIVVDNASPSPIAHTQVSDAGARQITLRRNGGACARDHGISAARGEFLLLLDDDSCPQPGALARMIKTFKAAPRLGCAGFRAVLPDGSEECSALPHVFIGCGAAFRMRAIRAVGGLDRSFFMAAEEYDLAFRLLQSGWRVENFADLAVDHLKSPGARAAERITFLDTRNNLRLVERYFPEPQRSIYRFDWMLRYRWLAAQRGHAQAYQRGRSAGCALAARERAAYRRWRLQPSVLDQLLSWKKLNGCFERLQRRNIRRVVFVDFGKNIFAFANAARLAGVQVSMIVDDTFAHPGPGLRSYRGIPILPVAAALTCPADAMVISNTSYAHAQRRQRLLAAALDIPIYNWFPPPAPSADFIQHSPAICPSPRPSRILSKCPS